MISVHFVPGLRTYLCEVPKRFKGPTKAYRCHEHVNYSVVRKIGSQNQFMKNTLYQSVPAPNKAHRTFDFYTTEWVPELEIVERPN